MSKNILFLLLLIFFSCQTTEQNNDSTDSEFQFLKTDTDKRNYLEEIFKTDQSSRQGQGSEIQQIYGKTSPEYQKFIKNSDRIDSLNLVKVESYVKHFGYPNPKRLGEIAAQTPWVVIHHARNYEDRLRNFKSLQKAYQNGHIDSGAFSLFLERMYNYKFRQRYIIEGKYNPQNQIDSLIKLLELNEK